MIIRKRAYARVGLVGNPSDGYFGKTIASAITNFFADVTLWESPTLQLVPHPANDTTNFHSLKELTHQVQLEGYYGGLRLLHAACKTFFEFCERRGIALDEKCFTVAYDTTIPRQVGLGGSSAIITATVRALMDFFDVKENVHIAKPELPNLILSVETEELGIAAGLQDRVIQVYGGTVFMDFDETLMNARGYGEYSYLDSRQLPPLYLAYLRRGTESGKVHNDVRYRFLSGDPQVHAAMKEFALYTVQAREALRVGDYKTLGDLFNRNFSLRRKIFGDAALGAQSIEMIEVGRALGCPCKFSGSNGAIVGIYSDEAQLSALEDAYTQRGYGFTSLHVEVRDDLDRMGTY